MYIYGMNKSVEIIRQTRSNLLEITKTLTLEQLNHIPDGFINNIIWNMGHIVAAQQGVCYKRAGVDIKVSDDFFMTYKPESKPSRFITQEESEEIKLLLFSTLDNFERDYQAQIFGNYPAWVTRYGVNIGSIDEAINFLPFHEGLHLGYIMALKRAVIKA